MIFLLVRHGHHAELGKVLSGRSAIQLSSIGLQQADDLADFLRDEPINAIYTSPLLRSCQTAAPLAARTGLQPKIEEAFQEIDFGAWTGRTFAELESEPDWKIWNEARTSIQPPGGESICQARDRIVGGMRTIADSGAPGKVVIVSHGDVIKAAVAHWQGLSLDELHTFDIEPGSITKLSFPCEPAGVLQINQLPAKIAR